MAKKLRRAGRNPGDPLTDAEAAATEWISKLRKVSPNGRKVTEFFDSSDGKFIRMRVTFDGEVIADWSQVPVSAYTPGVPCKPHLIGDV